MAKTSWIWWLLPIVLGIIGGVIGAIIGGVIGFLFLRGKDPGKAKNVLILGFVVAALALVYTYVFIGI